MPSPILVERGAESGRTVSPFLHQPGEQYHLFCTLFFLHQQK
ncbi:hypothetical protein LTSEWAN_3643 [Salmonella enterica subsp. enterica serovar Wandsworth str. A4-580]|uniref:Uncharacterized protein n=1 Tax=Salmonella enterica subsp. enterica serovar Wandsworth str. A4-580 TaxID=913086 RepID=G5SE56_SALET|nr:hypothetical protein LTSEWAN_3643 [Salmonella enterica subsp. enterica serovar Wandsworth str. A4-580]